MSQIDISKWKKFKVGHILAKVHTTKLKYRTRDLPKSADGIYKLPASTASTTNQGLSVYVPKENATILSNCLLVLANGDAGTVFYESKPFTILQDSYALNLTDNYKSHSSMNIYLYLASVLTKLFHRNFGWNNKAVWKRAKELTIQLPVDKNGDPNWQYMDTYIAKLTTLAHKNVISLKKAKVKPAKLNIDRWGEFKISDIYEHIEHPIARSKKHYESGNVPFIASGSVNNGIDCYLAPKNTQDIDKGNCLTISPVDGSCFYQSNDFLGRGGGGSAISILRTNKSLSQATHVFLASIIYHTLREQYSFGNMGNTQKIKNTIIKLPIDTNGDPDWQYMSDQVRHLATLSNLTITSLRSVI